MCDFTKINLEDVSAVTLELDIDGDIVDAAYNNVEFEIMEIMITESSIIKIVLSAQQPDGGPVIGQGRRWCRNDDEQWTDWTSSGGTLSYTVDVPAEAGTDWGYELRFALESEVKRGGYIKWKDPKMIVSRKGGQLK
jgi:hypothetical protein